jgi:hypothetical protein
VAEGAGKSYFVTYAHDEQGLDALTSGTGSKALANDPQFEYVFAKSGVPSAGAAARIHAKGASFKYAPAFDEDKLLPALSTGQQFALANAVLDPESIRQVARSFRDKAAQAGADYWSYNEVSSQVVRSPIYRSNQAAIFRALYDPDGSGTAHTPMRGVVLISQRADSRPSTWCRTNCPASVSFDLPAGQAAPKPGQWDSSAPGSTVRQYWEAIDDTAQLVVQEEYLTAERVAGPRGNLAALMFGARAELAKSTNPKVLSVAFNKYTVMLSGFYGHAKRDPSSTTCAGFKMNWAGVQAQPALAGEPVLAGHYLADQGSYYRFLAKEFAVVRNSGGGANRIGIAPLRAEVRDAGAVASMGFPVGVLPQVGPVLASIYNWHYRNPDPAREKLDYLGRPSTTTFVYQEHPEACR